MVKLEVSSLTLYWVIYWRYTYIELDNSITILLLKQNQTFTIEVNEPCDNDSFEYEFCTRICKRYYQNAG